MILSFAEYKNKMMGCWAGKNMGGVLGAPFECRRGEFNVAFYTQDLSGDPPPNDDLDLQIIWLAAVEKFGRAVDASILGEYWLSFVIPHWAEYGTGKMNLRAGLQPPLSGAVENTYKDSCGCFIRSEIWACLAPGLPQLAVRYAYEDAIVDHAGEGVWAEIFCAAMQSAAFVESDVAELIRIALSYIPEDCAVARAVLTVQESYAQGLSWRDARKAVRRAVPGTFGILGARLSDIPPAERDLPTGEPGFDAPENIGFMILGLLYGEGDFARSLCTAVNCGEDTDCTAATLGALLGILQGADALPEKWTAPLNDKISTMCIDKTTWSMWVPETVSQLTERVLRVTPGFLGMELCDLFAEGGYAIRAQDNLYCEKPGDYLPMILGAGKPVGIETYDLIRLTPFVIREDFPAFTVAVDCGDSARFRAEEDRTIGVAVWNTGLMQQQAWARIRVDAPQGVSVLSGQEVMKLLQTLYSAKGEAYFTFNASDYRGSKLELLVTVSIEGRHSYGTVKITLLREESSGRSARDD